MRQILRLKDCGSDFLTRRQGKVVRERLVKEFQSLTPGDVLGIDFAQVETMSPSFADECFGKFAEVVGAGPFRTSVFLIGANDTIRTLVNAVLADRIASS